MAEERLIDDDKDRKYKIRINEDGEEELYIDETPDDEEEEIPVFAVEETEEDDEEAAILTPEQLAERERLKEERELARAKKLSTLTAEAKTAYESGDFDGTLTLIARAEEYAENDGELYALKLLALTRNLTEFSAEGLAETAEGVKNYSTEEQKSALKELSQGLKDRIDAVGEETAGLHVENERKKEERRAFFASEKKRASGKFALAVIPFAVLLVLAIAFSTVMFSEENGTFLYVTIALACLAVIAFVLVLLAAKGLWAAQRKVILNERDASTELGRKYVAKKQEAELLLNVFTSFGGQL